MPPWDRIGPDRFLARGATITIGTLYDKQLVFAGTIIAIRDLIPDEHLHRIGRWSPLILSGFNHI